MKHKKILAVVLACVMLFCCASISAFAASPQQTGAPLSLHYDNFANVWADIYETSWGYYDVSGGASVYSNDITVSVTVYVESYYSDGEWHPYDSWEVTGSGTAIANAAGSRTLTTPGVYRAHTVADAYIGGVLVETVEAYSTNVVVG